MGLSPPRAAHSFTAPGAAWYRHPAMKRTILRMLDEAVSKWGSAPYALRKTDAGFVAVSFAEARDRAREFAAWLLSTGFHRGDVEAARFLAGFYRAGVLKAAATVGRRLELAAVERLMRLHRLPSAAEFSNESFDLVAAANAAAFRQSH